MRNAAIQTFLLLTLLFQGAFCAADSIPPKSIYSVSPQLDGAIIIAGTALTAAAYGFNSSLTRKRCPCDRGEINPFDRGVVGNNSQFASVASDITELKYNLIALDAYDYRM